MAGDLLALICAGAVVMAGLPRRTPERRTAAPAICLRRFAREIVARKPAALFRPACGRMQRGRRLLFEA